MQQALDVWVADYNTLRPHQALGMRPPVERFQIAAPKLDPAVEAVLEPALVPAGQPVVQPSAPIVRLPGVQRWVDRHGLISLGGFGYRVPIVLAGEPVEAVAADHLVRIFHREVLVAEDVQRRKPDTGQRQQVRPRQGSRRSRRPTDGMVVTRVVDSSGYVSFAGTNYRSATAGAAAAPKSASWPVRCSCLATARSSGCTRSGTTGPRSMVRSPPRTGGPATDRMRRPEPASRPSRCAVGLPAEP